MEVRLPTEVSRDGDEWTVTGDLTIKDVTKPVTIEFEENGSAKDPFGNVRVGFEATSPSTGDWGLTWNAALETGRRPRLGEDRSSSTSRRSRTPEHPLDARADPRDPPASLLWPWDRASAEGERCM